MTPEKMYSDGCVSFELRSGWKVSADEENRSYNIRVNNGDVIMVGFLSEFSATHCRFSMRDIQEGLENRYIREEINFGTYVGMTSHVLMLGDEKQHRHKVTSFLESVSTESTLYVEVYFNKPNHIDIDEYGWFIESISKIDNVSQG